MNDNLAVKAKKLTLLAKFFAESSLMLSSGIDEYSTDAKLIEFEKDKDRLIRDLYTRYRPFCYNIRKYDK
jgi:hypothetical protein